MLKLYHWWSSTCSRRVRIGLAAKGLEWESVYVNLRTMENLEPWYVKLNPNGVVPTLDHDGRIVIESNFILEYLDDVWPDVPLRPEDPYERARMRIWMDKFEHVLHDLAMRAARQFLHGGGVWRDQGAAGKRRVAPQRDLAQTRCRAAI